MCKEETWIQDGGEARPEDLLLEQQLDNPILQVAPFLIMIMIVLMVIIIMIVIFIIMMLTKRLDLGSWCQKNTVDNSQFFTQGSSLCIRLTINDDQVSSTMSPKSTQLQWYVLSYRVFFLTGTPLKS